MMSADAWGVMVLAHSGDEIVVVAAAAADSVVERTSVAAVLAAELAERADLSTERFARDVVEVVSAMFVANLMRHQ